MESFIFKILNVKGGILLCVKRELTVYCWKVNEIVRYVGSGKDITDSRKSNHLARLRKGTHIKELQMDYDTYGEASFDFVILEECGVKECFEKEKIYSQLYQDTIYNKNEVKNTKKRIKTGLKAKRHKEKFSELMSGENNPNCSKLTKEQVRQI